MKALIHYYGGRIIYVARIKRVASNGNAPLRPGHTARVASRCVALRRVALQRDASIFLEHMQIIVNGYTGCVATRHRALRCVTTRRDIYK